MSVSRVRENRMHGSRWRREEPRPVGYAARQWRLPPTLPVGGTRRLTSKPVSSSTREATMGLVSRDDGWRMPDWLWERVEPLLPERPAHPLGCHNPRVPDRDAMDAILLVLRTGMQWNALNATDVCSSSSAHRRFQEWEQAGVFHEIWRQGLLEYDTVVGIDWAWLAADGAMTKAPLGGPKTGPNPTDRAKKGRNVRFSARERGPRSGWRTTAPTATTNRSSSRP